MKGEQTLMILNHIYTGNTPDVLRTLPDDSMYCCITSPPYWGLRDYGIEAQIWDGDPACQHEWGDEKKHPAKADRNTEGKDRNGNGIFGTTVLPRGSQQAKSVRGSAYSTGSFCIICDAWRGSFGLEPTPDLYLKHAVAIFREVRRVLKKDGTLWLNIGDTYSSGGRSTYRSGASNNKGHQVQDDQVRPKQPPGLKTKDLIGVPWRFAFALQADGWYLRQDIIWSKPTPMPESVKDRCTKSHEYIFLFSKSERYYYDQDAIKEPASPNTQPRYARGRSTHHKNADGGPGNQTIAASFAHMVRQPGVNKKAVAGWQTVPGSHTAIEHNQGPKDAVQSDHGLKDSTKFGRGAGWRSKQNPSFAAAVKDVVEFRNKRSVWSVSPEPFPESHFATFPQKLIVPMILTGAPPHSVVLDPFMGAGTVAVVARKLGRDFIGIELNPNYVSMANRRIEKEIGLLFEETSEG